MLERRKDVEKEFQTTRDELRKQENRLDKRESMLDEQHQDYLKRERLLEQRQTQLAERGKAMDAREKELDRLLKEEQEQLYKITGLDQSAATNLLLERLDRELKNETGGLILAHQSRIKEECDRQAREAIGMAVQRYAAATHLKRPSRQSTFPTTT